MFYAFWVFITMVIEHFLVWKYDVASTQMNWFGVAFMIGMICVALTVLFSDYFRRPVGRIHPARDGKKSGIPIVSPLFYTGSELLASIRATIPLSAPFQGFPIGKFSLSGRLLHLPMA